MKSLLVDALRAANDNDDSLELEETIVPGTLVSPPPKEEEAVPVVDSDLELLESLSETADLEAANGDARFPGEIQTEEQRLPAKTIVAAHSRGAVFERAVIWMPVACLVLAAVSAAAFSGWSSVTGVGQNADLNALSGQADLPGGQDEVDSAAQSSRFVYLDVAPTPAVSVGRPVPASGDSRETRTSTGDIAISRAVQAPRSIAGITDVDDASFSSVAAVYQAFESGRIAAGTLERLLARRAAAGGESVELEIKLLLHRYPDSAPLHNALGTLYVNSARWPEARVAFDRAGELADSTNGSTLR
jgi:hypothetical protein